MKPICSLLAVLIAGLVIPAAGKKSHDAETTATAADFTSDIYQRQAYVRVEVRYPGVYRITGHELASSGLDLKTVDPGRLALYNEGTSVPVHVVAGTSGSFGPDDYLEFIGKSPHGSDARSRPENLSNVYFLTWGDAGSPLRYKPATVGAPAEQVPGAVFWADEYREKNFQFRYSALPPGITDNFYWLFYQAGQDPSGILPLHLDFPGFEPSVGKSVHLTLRLFGITNVASLRPSHKFSALYGKYDLGSFAFDGVQFHEFSTTIPASQIKHRQRLTFQTPPDRMSAVDQIALDSIRVQYPRRLNAQGGDYFVFNNRLIGQKLPSRHVPVEGLKPGSRIFDLQQRLIYPPADSTTSYVSMSDVPTTFVAVSPEGHLRPDRLTLRPGKSVITEINRDVETLVLYHPDLQQTAELYTKYRQSHGMRVKSTRVTDVYDALNDGFISDLALKQYVRYAAEQSQKLRYLVLLGDSTYDFREARTYDEENPPRVLVPIHWVHNPSTTWSGGYQDDNWYGSLAEQYRPDLAVGRIPAASDEAGMEYVRKVIEHEVLKHSRDDKALLISSVEKSFQELVKEVSRQYGNRFTTTTMLFPEKEHATREVGRIRDEISSGVQLLYYVGHGGSLVWRVGPTDFQQQKDLFTPADVRALSNRGHYPIVACSSCYTTSFDQGESLGEALILQPGGGAIAILGSPWKATVHESHAFNAKLIKYYFDPKVTRLGEAALLAHREVTPVGVTRPSFQSFTLLGDPCLEIVKR